MRQSTRLTTLALAGLTLIGCTGDSGDIGPLIPRIEDDTFRVLVRNNEDVGVVNAFVGVTGWEGAPRPTRPNGRADLVADPNGAGVVTVDASFARAGQNDALAGLTIATDFDGDELPFVVFLPDLADSAGIQLQAGVQAGAATLNDTATSGAIVTIQAGATVASGGAAQFTLRTGILAAHHLPPLRFPNGGLALPTDGVFVGPKSFTCQPAAGLSVPNRLGLPAGTRVPLLHLDTEGAWSEVGAGTVTGNGARIASATAVRTGGLYTFARRSSVTGIVTGRVLQLDGEPLTQARVRVGQLVTQTDDEGRFSADRVVALDGQGQARTVAVEIHGGRRHRPSSTTVDVTVIPGGGIDVGDVEIDSYDVGDLRLLMITRGRADAREDFAVTALEGRSVSRGVTDRDGMLRLNDFEAGLISFLSTRPFFERKERDVLTSEGLVSLPEARRSIDQRFFRSESDWIGGNRGGTAHWIVDDVGRGFFEDAVAIRDTGSGDELIEVTREFRLPRATYGENGQATATAFTTASGRPIASAFTVLRPLSGRIEMPLMRSHTPPLGVFDEFGLVRGAIPGPGATRRVHVTEIMSPDRWFDGVLNRQSLVPNLPVDLDPSVANEFQVGAPAKAGNIVVWSGDVAGPSTTLRGLRMFGEFEPARRGVTELDLPNLIAVDEPFDVPLVFAGRDAAIPVTDFGFDLAIERPDGLFVDAVRGVTGNVAPVGTAARFTLPRRVDELAGVTYHMLFGGTTEVAGTRRSQRTLVRVPSNEEFPRLLPVPEIATPLAGAGVDARGFAVRFRLPERALYGVVHLQRIGPNATFDWKAIVPQETTEFVFRELPDGVTPLVAGDYTLEVSAFQISADSLVRVQEFNAYQTVISRWVGISAWEREVEATSSARIGVTLR